MARRELMLLWLILLSHSRQGKAEPEDDNGTLRAEELPNSEAGPIEAPEVQGEGTPGDENSTLRAEEVGPTEEAEVQGQGTPGDGNSTSRAEEVGPTEEAEVQGKGTPEPSAGPLGIAPGFFSVCPCDLHPGFCDLNCCCDISCGPECNSGGPECPFSFCLPGSTRAASWMCLEKSLIFRNNTPFHTEILPDLDGCALLFCVQLNDSKLNYWQQPQVVTETNFPTLSAQYGGSSFILPEQVQTSPSTFYRVGDPIETYFASSSILSVLKQPTHMGPSRVCIDENPAAFLESKSTSCIRILTDLMSSCTTDPALDAVSYYRDFSVLKLPGNITVIQSRQVNITPLSEPASPSLDGSTCYNVVSEVIYEIEFSGIQGIQNVSVQFRMVNISGNPGCTLQQHFSLHFGSRNTSFTKRRSGNPGYIMGEPLIALYNGTQQPITILQNQGDGHCSATERYNIRFGENVRTSCQFRMPFKLEEANCSHLQEILYQAFQGQQSPGSLAITGNANPAHPGEWNRFFYQKCSIQGEHCMLPFSLEIQVIWAQVGLLSNPQAEVLGARYNYHCRPLESFFTSTNLLPLTTVAAFTDTTKWPDPPRGQPRVSWKLPFDFFFPFKVALSAAVSSSGSLACTLLTSLMLHGLDIS